MDLKNFKNFDNHEMLAILQDKRSGLLGAIAIHNTSLGPATGGTRIKPYPNLQAAIEDALRLSKAMTYKCALAGIPNGGGKAVIIAKNNSSKPPALLKAYAKRLNMLAGNFTTGEDIGVTHDDLHILHKYSPYVNGRQAGELGPWAALGVFYAMQGASKAVFGNKNLKGRTIVIKGLGKVGLALVDLIMAAGGNVIAADIDPGRTAAAQKKYPNIKIAKTGQINKISADIFSPCALSDDLNPAAIRELKCKLVCGAANNQLASPECNLLMQKLGITYVPDFVANAGGLINVAGELNFKNYNKKWVRRQVEKIYGQTLKIIRTSRLLKKPEHEVAVVLANKILKI